MPGFIQSNDLTDKLHCDTLKNKQRFPFQGYVCTYPQTHAHTHKNTHKNHIPFPTAVPHKYKRHQIWHCSDHDKSPDSTVTVPHGNPPPKKYRKKWMQEKFKQGRGTGSAVGCLVHSWDLESQGDIFISVSEPKWACCPVERSIPTGWGKSYQEWRRASAVLVQDVPSVVLAQLGHPGDLKGRSNEKWLECLRHKPRGWQLHIGEMRHLQSHCPVSLLRYYGCYECILLSHEG